MKHCARCDQELPFSDFNKRARSADGLQTYCRRCQGGWYADNRRAHLENVQRRKKRVAVEIRLWLADYLLAHPCVDCGERDPIVLEFDHVRGFKKASIADMLTRGFSLQAIEAELAKCEVRCANCHRRRTAHTLGSWRTSVAQPDRALDF